MADVNATLHVVEHPLIVHLLTEARKSATAPPMFRQILRQIGSLLAYEATRDLKLDSVNIDTPMEPVKGKRLSRPVTVVPILRAGLGMAEGVVNLIPEARVGHLGMFRDEAELRPVSYYDKMPADVHEGPVLVVDPMLATGGSAAAATQYLKDRKCRDIRFICLVAAPEGVKRLSRDHSDVPIFTAALDRQLNERGYILPGLGDAGDRLFGTG